MSMWQPGNPVTSADDADEHALWRRYRTLKCQQVRRAKVRRIDFYVAPEAATVIDGLRTAEPGGDASSIINMIIAEWADTRRLDLDAVEGLPSATRYLRNRGGF